MSRQSPLLGVFAALMLLVAAGCQNAAPAPAHAAAGPQRAVVISGGQGAPTTVYLPAADGGAQVSLASAGAGDGCADCRAAAADYFRTGKIDPKCAHCGATRTVVTDVSAPLGHN